MTSALELEGYSVLFLRQVISNKSRCLFNFLQAKTIQQHAVVNEVLDDQAMINRLRFGFHAAIFKIFVLQKSVL